jgi:primosomal protein N' (replication factor Y)
MKTNPSGTPPREGNADPSGTFPKEGRNNSCPLGASQRDGGHRIEVLFPLSLQALSYRSVEAIPLFCRVAVLLGKKKRIGIVYSCQKITADSLPEKYQLKPIEEIIDREPILPPKLNDLILWMTTYYYHWEGIIWQTALPRRFWLDKPAPSDKEIIAGSLSEKQKNTLRSFDELNAEQQKAIQTIQKEPQGFTAWLLHGVTGSGKTEVYLQLTQACLNQGKQILILVPEIALTQQNIHRFSQCFDNLYVYHSERTEKKRAIAWQAAREGIAQIILGTRSAVFTPLDNLGMIIIDEEHDDSYRQHDGVHYCARDVGVMRAKLEGIPIVLGSATPSFESLHNTYHKHYRLLSLPQRAGEGSFPKTRFIDMRQRNSSLSEPLIKEIKANITKKEQSILFLNRRGYSPVLICHSCGWIPECIHCERPPTFHRKKDALHCHICDWKARSPSHCPSCQSNDLRTLGDGTEKIEELLREQFPQATIARLDRDSTQRKGSMQAILKKMHDNEIDILLGTQMVSKGHDLPNVTLVGIINTDQGLLSPHYRTEEKLIQLITQVSGRSGRGEKNGQVLIQTHHPTHPTLQNLFQYGYIHSANKLLNQRQSSKLPPYYPQALLRVECPNQQHATDFIQKAHKIVLDYTAQNNLQEEFIIYPVVPASIEKIGIHYRLQFLIHCTHRKALHQLLKPTINTIKQWQRPSLLRWSLRLDPTEL